MPYFQHRVGAPAAPRNNAHTRWEQPRAAISLRAWLWGIGLSLALWSLIIWWLA